jgi:hypothetical protein
MVLRLTHSEKGTISLKISQIGKDESFLRWLPPPKLSKVGLFGASHGRQSTTTGSLGPFFVVFASG